VPTTDLTARAIKNGLDTVVMGCRVRSYSTVGSTMDAARRLAELGCAEGTLIVADTQTSGRGRFNRPWASPPGTNLTFSIVLRPSPELLRDMNMAATVALVRCISDVSGLKPTVKWPNDLRIGGKKVCGVLIEGHLAVRPQKGARDNSYVILGVGLNVNYDPTPVLTPPAEATSLATELGRPVARLDVLRAFLRAFDELYRTLDAGDSLYQEWRSCLDTLGQHVRVRWGDPDTSGQVSVEEGLAEDVDRNGDLVLRRADGSTVSLNAGEVTLRVSAP
jgi:BirA family biotin operon repressor/biotin-[acetyl-CoA-carboxylase] ligase